MRTTSMFVAACVLAFIASAVAGALIVAITMDGKPAQPRMEIRWYQMCIPGEREGWSQFGHCPRKFWDA